MLPLLWLGLLAGLAVVPSGSTAWADDAPDLSSTNLDCVANFLARAEAATGTVTVVAFGDSLQPPYRSICKFLFGALQERLGNAGIVFAPQTPPVAVQELGGGAYVRHADAVWWPDSVMLPPGGHVQWSNTTHATGSLPADAVGVHYVARPGAGVFSLSLSTNGGPWAEIARVDAYAAAPRGMVTNVPVAVEHYRIRVDALSGTHRVLGPQLERRSSAGVRTAHLFQGPMDMEVILNVNPDVQRPVLRNLRPDLLVWHMKDVGDLGQDEALLGSLLDDFEAMLREEVPSADVLYIGTPFMKGDQSTNVTERQNMAVRAAALRNGRAYVDCMTPYVSYEYMVTNSLMADNSHPNNIANEQMADIVWSELGLYALRVDRRLDMERSGSALVVSCPTTHDLRYVLESSTNLLEWVAMTNAAGDGSMLVVTNQAPAEDSEVYRLRLEE